MAVLATALAVAAPLVLAGEQGMFHFPEGDDFRMQAIARTDREEGWPFSVPSGYLFCAWLMAEKVVYFVEEPDDPEDYESWEEARMVHLSRDPVSLAFVNIGNSDLFAPFDGIEQLLVRVAPFVRLGERLCDQPRGTEIGPGEL